MSAKGLPRWILVTRTTLPSITVVLIFVPFGFQFRFILPPINLH